jgi:hypothetical protein
MDCIQEVQRGTKYIEVLIAVLHPARFQSLNGGQMLHPLGVRQRPAIQVAQGVLKDSGRNAFPVPEV